MYDVGLSTCGFELTEENFKALQQSNIKAIEISMRFDRYKDIDYKRVKELSEKYGIKLWSYHLPFVPFEEIDPSSKSKSVRENTVAYFSRLIKLSADIGIDKFVVHPSGEPIPDADRTEKLAYSAETLDKLAEIAHKSGAVIAVENLPRTCLGNSAEEISSLIAVNDKLRVCFDTNHLLSGDFEGFVKKHGDKIITLHVSDYDFIDERHWLPGEGGIDWCKMRSSLENARYGGVWMYELGLKTPKGITREKELTFADFYNNAVGILK